jgi:hypothetical protein
VKAQEVLGKLPSGGDWACWALRHPEHLPHLQPSAWDLLIRQAKRADVLARIAYFVSTRGEMESIPREPRRHLQAALILAEAQHREVKREAGLIEQALRELQIPVVLLKGSAYVMAGLPAAQGRLFSDTDILVPRGPLPVVEGQLMLHGWMGGHHDAYDQRYYREWMHELPPMEHVQRQTVLDVHHNILPLTTRRPPDASLLLADAIPVEGHDRLHVLAPVDMLLHSMTHLFYNDDLSHGLRDLSDLDLLLRHFGAQPGFGQALLRRADLLHLQRPLHYGLWACQEFFETPLPAGLEVALERWREAVAPAWPLSALMSFLWRRGLRTPHPSAALQGTGLAHALLYMRAHALRMPPFMLLKHLSIKAWKRAAPPRATSAA